jgi:hypothetical protein
MALVWIVDFTTLAAQDSTNNPDTLIQRPQLQRELTRYLQRDSEHHQEVIMPSMSTYIKAISGYVCLTKAYGSVLMLNLEAQSLS